MYARIYVIYALSNNRKHSAFVSHAGSTYHRIVATGVGGEVRNGSPCCDLRENRVVGLRWQWTNPMWRHVQNMQYIQQKTSYTLIYSIYT